MSGITVTGTVLKTEHRAGTFTDKTDGRSVSYDFVVARLLVDDEVVEVKFKSDRPDVRPPSKGDTISVQVSLPRGTKPVAVEYAQRPAVKSA